MIFSLPQLRSSSSNPTYNYIFTYFCNISTLSPKCLVKGFVASFKAFSDLPFSTTLTIITRFLLVFRTNGNLVAKDEKGDSKTFIDDFWFARPIDIFCTTFIPNPCFWYLLQRNRSAESKWARLYQIFYYNTKKFSMMWEINTNATIAVTSDVDCNLNLPGQKSLFTASSILKLYSEIEVWNAYLIK